MVMNVSCACATAALPANSAATERPSAVDLTSVSFIGPSLPFFKPVKLSLRQRIAAVDRGCARPLSPSEPVGGDRGSASTVDPEATPVPPTGYHHPYLKPPVVSHNARHRSTPRT